MFVAIDIDFYSYFDVLLFCRLEIAYLEIIRESVPNVFAYIECTAQLMDFKTRLTDKTTSELISVFQDGSKPQSAKENAFIALCTRFRKELLEKCEIVCKRYGHSVVIAEQIADETFRKYALKPNYQWNESKAKDYDTGFLIYLLGITRKELTNYYRAQKRKLDGCDYDGTEQIITELPPIPEERLDVETRVKHAAIQSLSARHKTVYLTYEFHQRKGFNLPRKLQVELREHLGIEKQSRVRGIKKEAVDKVNAYIEAMNITKNGIR